MKRSDPSKRRPAPQAPAARAESSPFDLTRLEWLALPLVLVATALVHWPALSMGFAQDDITFLSRARGLSAVPWSMARPLSEGILWWVLQALFGLNPLPYHVFTFALHLANVALVYAIGRRLLRSVPAAAAAATLFGVSAIAFTPLHWTSGLVEITVATGTLGAFVFFLVAREHGKTPLLWLSALLVFAALTCKESAILFPLVLLVAHLRLDGRPTAPARTLFPPTVAAALYALAFLATIRAVHYARSETYSMSSSPAFIMQNFSTYLAWITALGTPIRDAVAAMAPDSWRVGWIVLAALAVGLWWQRRDPRHPAEVGVVWFAVFLAPVVALRYHTYLYYLYLPLPGLCWAIAAFGQKFARRAPRIAPALLAFALLVIVTAEFRNVRARHVAMMEVLPADKTVREAFMLRNALDGLRAAGIAPGDAIAFVNPAPLRRFALTGPDTSGMDIRISYTRISYIPLEGALRGGEAIRLFFPGVEYLGFSRDIPPEWENAKTFLYQDEGTVRLLGTGAKALAELGYFSVRLHDWAAADSMFRRSFASGDTLADALFGSIVTRTQLGDPGAAARFAREFLRRFPNDERAATVRAGLSGSP